MKLSQAKFHLNAGHGHVLKGAGEHDNEKTLNTRVSLGLYTQFRMTSVYTQLFLIHTQFIIHAAIHNTKMMLTRTDEE